MLSEGNSGSYDKFRDRIMFPIHDRRGRVIAFGGRALADDGPKYLNSPETDLISQEQGALRSLPGPPAVRQAGHYYRGRGLYGCGCAGAVRFQKRRSDIRNRHHRHQVELLFRAADTVIYCFDGDKAGRKAAWRALEATLPKLRDGLQARFLFLPDGEDPDSMVRKHGEEVLCSRLKCQSLSEFFFDHFTCDQPIWQPGWQGTTGSTGPAYIETIPEGVFRNMMTESWKSLHSTG